LDCTNVDKIPEKPEPEVSEECIICFEENDGEQYLDCMHACCCKVCFDALKSCPICKKRAKKIKTKFENIVAAIRLSEHSACIIHRYACQRYAGPLKKM